MASERHFVRTTLLVVLAVCSAEAAHEGRPSKPAARGPLPASAADPVTIGDAVGSFRTRVSLLGATPEARDEGSSVRTTATFRAAGPFTSDVTFRTTPDGVEDFVRYETKPPVEETAYRIDVREAAGLRLVENVLELLDAAGTPRIRMAAPTVADARGTRDATVVLEGCAADRNPAAPWGRPVVAPGAASCVVHVHFGDPERPLAYPVVVDPKWGAAKSVMTQARRGHTATLLASGKVLIAGGETGAVATPTRAKTAELFDPVTATFAATGAMTDPRAYHVAALLSNNDVLVASGAGTAGALSSAELYDETTGKFTTTGSLLTARRNATIAPSGATFVAAGGQDTSGAALDSAETYSLTTGMWTATGRMAAKRFGHAAFVLQATGQSVVAGGANAATLGDIASTERLAAGVWISAGSLTAARRDLAGATLPDGTLLVAGGYQASTGTELATTELYDPTKGAWGKVGSLGTARSELRLTALANGAAVATGGLVRDAKGAVTSTLKTVELYDPVAQTWSSLPDMTGARADHTATLLSDGRVLVAGGSGAAAALDTAEILSLDVDGTACTAAATCASGFCADGVCCKTVCDGKCMGCTLALTGAASGTCAEVLAGKDSRNDCTDDGAPACTQNGFCDGSGACATYATTTACTPSACTDDKECTSGFCVDGICCDSACDGPCEACTKAKKGTGTDGTCGPVKKGTDPDADCGKLGTGVCAADGTCDGAGGCVVPTQGTACAAAKCSDKETAAAAAKCGASGDCTPALTSCAPFLCNAKTFLCTSTCTTDTDCATGAHCKDSVCARSENGTSCTADTDCTSAFCVDGVCCDVACDGQCEACDVANHEGTCSPVTGTPHGSRTACTGSDPCLGECNGVARDICIYPDSTTTCGDGTSSCSDGSETENRCNGIGACVPTPTPCAPFACGDTACNTRCKKDADCSPDATCQSGTCVLGSSACGDSGVGPDGGCAVPAAAKQNDSSGCGCRTAPEGRDAPGALGLGSLLSLALVLRRRRREAR